MVASSFTVMALVFMWISFMAKLTAFTAVDREGTTGAGTVVLDKEFIIGLCFFVVYTVLSM